MRTRARATVSFIAHVRLRGSVRARLELGLVLRLEIGLGLG